MTETKIYRPNIVQQIRDYYGSDLYHTAYPTIRQHLSQLAEKLYEGIQTEHEFLYTEINNYHPLLLGEPTPILRAQSLDLIDCQWTIAAQYGFKSWEDILGLHDTPYDTDFESSIDALLSGNISLLKEIIERNHSILKTRSQYGHKASILHYVASNGVELWRQQVPTNLVEVASLLLNNGANKHALMNVYGSQFDTYTLLKTSAHPYQAGVGRDLESLLKI